MTLKDWLAMRRLSHVEFARRIDRTAEAVRRYVAGERIPDKSTMPLIVEQTDGAVTANDFFGIETAPEAQPAAPEWPVETSGGAEAPACRPFPTTEARAASSPTSTRTCRTSAAQAIPCRPLSSSGLPEEAAA